MDAESMKRQSRRMAQLGMSLDVELERHAGISLFQQMSLLEV